MGAVSFLHRDGRTLRWLPRSGRTQAGAGRSRDGSAWTPLSACTAGGRTWITARHVGGSDPVRTAEGELRDPLLILGTLLRGRRALPRHTVRPGPNEIGAVRGHHALS